MKKRKIALLLCGFLLLSACKSREVEGTPTPEAISPRPTVTVEESPAPEVSPEPTETPAPVETEQPSPTPSPAAERNPLAAPWGSTPPETEDERRLAFFGAVMERFYEEGLFPDGTPVDLSGEPLDKNQFALHDVDGDGREELVVRIVTAAQPARTALVYDYTDQAGLVLELKATSQLSFFAGVAQAGWPVDLTSGSGVLWPYTLYRYEEEGDSYAEAGSAQARTESLEGVKFPREADLDGDGIVYCLDMDYEHPVDGPAYTAWRDGLVRGREMDLCYYAWTEESIADIPNLLTLEKARKLIEQGNAALAPFLGEGAEGESFVDEQGVSWRKLEGYTSRQELLEGLKEVFVFRMAEAFFDSYSEALLLERPDGVYVRTDSRDILGHYYDMDLETLQAAIAVMGWEELPFYSADGNGNGTQVQWKIGFEKEQGNWRIIHYTCAGPNDYLYEMVLNLDGKPYGIDSVGSPDWLGEPIEREIWGEDFTRCREVYPGFEVEIWSDYPGRQNQPAMIYVTAPGISTVDGVEVGDTMKEVLGVYPQFSFGGRSAINPRLSYPTNFPYGEFFVFSFDENLILERIEMYYNIAN